MRYKYCPKCDIARPRTLMMDDRCEACRDEAITIKVHRSVYGRAMYLTSGMALALILLLLAHRDYNAGFASFISGMDGTPYIGLVFGLIVVSFVFSYLDLGRTNREARQIIEERKGRLHE
ncbi:MAG: hypothetical protein SA339_10565 [Methanomassiliicoccus sp.]|nr:hypothetical protein [Methanomassiliicoccus sp.]